MSGYRRMGRERKRYLRALRLAYEESTLTRTGLRDKRAAFRAARRARRAGAAS